MSGENKKPEIVLTSYGRHNENIEDTFSRIYEGASWKKQRIVVIIPSATNIPVKVAFSIWNLMFPPNQPVYKMLALGMEVGDAYSNAIEVILDHPELSQWEYILTVEHDNVPPPDGVARLIKIMDEHPEYSAVSGLYFTKGESGVAQIWGDPKDHILNFRPQPPVPGQLIECCGTGMGFVLWRISMFKDPKLRKPWFVTKFGAEGLSTQDLYFWADARKYGYRCAVDCATTVGHYDSTTGITW
jgi:hypothetical protein